MEDLRVLEVVALVSLGVAFRLLYSLETLEILETVRLVLEGAKWVLVIPPTDFQLLVLPSECS